MSRASCRLQVPCISRLKEGLGFRVDFSSHKLVLSSSIEVWNGASRRLGNPLFWGPYSKDPTMQGTLGSHIIGKSQILSNHTSLVSLQ